MVTMITLGSGLLSELFGGFVVVESLFRINGLGLLLLDAAKVQDAPVIVAFTIVSVSLLLFSILLATCSSCRSSRSAYSESVCSTKSTTVQREPSDVAVTPAELQALTGRSPMAEAMS